MVLSVKGANMNTNKMACWADNYSNEELESMFEEYKSQEREKDEKYGKYRSEYEEELQRLRDRYEDAFEVAASKLSDLYERKWEVMKGYPSFWGKEAA